MDLIYPVGSILWTSSTSDPNVLYPFTSWTQIKDTFIYAKGSKNLNATGGAETVTLTVANLPSHRHGERCNIDNSDTPNYNVDNYTSPLITARGTTGSANVGPCGDYKYGLWIEDPRMNHQGYQVLTDATGSGTAVNKMPPYVVKYCWERTN